jgi:hypothetical protein
MKALSIAFSISFVAAAVLFSTAGLFVMASLFLADTRPVTGVYFGMHLIVSAVFMALGLVIAGILVQVSGLVRLVSRPDQVDGFQLSARLSRLIMLLLISGLFLCLIMKLVTYGILARIDQGFAVFG